MKKKRRVKRTHAEKRVGKLLKKKNNKLLSVNVKVSLGLKNKKKKINIEAEQQKNTSEKQSTNHDCV